MRDLCSIWNNWLYDSLPISWSSSERRADEEPFNLLKVINELKKEKSGQDENVNLVQIHKYRIVYSSIDEE
jgi:hypothetical protein